MQPGTSWVNPVTFAFQGVKAGMSARAAREAFRAAGGQLRDATWFQIYGEAKTAYGRQIVEADLLLNMVPRSGEVSSMATKQATGHIQYVEVYVRDKETGIVSTRPFAVRGQDLLRRNDVIERALARFHAAIHEEGAYSNETVVGAAYTATYRLDPVL